MHDKSALETFYALIGSAGPAVKVKVKPETYAQPLGCYANVARKMVECGGNICYGWLILSDSFVLTAHHQAVWQDDRGELTCIVASDAEVTTITFVPDPLHPYQGEHIPPIMVNVSGNPMVDDFIELSKLAAQLTPHKNTLDHHTQELNVKLRELRRQIEDMTLIVADFVLKGGKPGGPCPCHSGKSYENCHRKAFKNVANIVQATVINRSVRSTRRSSRRK